MFTGIVQALGVVESIRSGSSGARLVLHAPDLPRPLADGASVCVSGVCLTVARSDDARMELDVVPETLSRTTLGDLAPGRRVNLERSLAAGDPLDGHVVQGHVDGTAIVRAIRRSGPEGHLCTFGVDEAAIPYMIPKGSVAVDGVSLTVVAVDGPSFGVALIPTTLARTTLGSLRIGDRVNIETDILVRTIVTTMERWRRRADAPAITVDMLRDGGW